MTPAWFFLFICEDQPVMDLSWLVGYIGKQDKFDINNGTSCGRKQIMYGVLDSSFMKFATNNYVLMLFYTS